MVLRVGRARLAACLAAMIALGAVAPVSARAQAADELMATHAALDRVLAAPETPARRRRLVRLLDRTLDYEMIARRVLVVHWEGLNEAQRAEVTDLLTRAVRHRYAASVEALRGWRVAVTSDAPRGVGRRVETRAERGSETRRIGYDLYAADGAHRVVDLIVDGESLVHQYRAQFNHVIRREGWGGFLQRLRARVEQDEA